MVVRLKEKRRRGRLEIIIRGLFVRELVSKTMNSDFYKFFDIFLILIFNDQMNEKLTKWSE